jgi:hypothetical protein
MRLYRRGTVQLPARLTPEQRFWAKVNKTETCWLWTGATSGNGYGVFGVTRKMVMAHRWLYEHEIAPIPNERDLDHLCRVRLCVNPAHLEPVSRRENLLRGAGFGGQLHIHP